MKQTLEEAAQSMAYNKMPDWGGLPALAKKYFIKGAEWQAKQSPWISVEERLPKDIPGAPLVVILEDGKTGYYNARYTDNYEFVTMDGQLLHNVAYWQPIPSFDEILEANKDVLERIKEKGD
jgi:hypothetical protein|nr:MAG TPA: Protein of unknown function (DUF551) [Caudoviricetes sp.]